MSRVTPDKVLVGSREQYSILGFGATIKSSGSGVQYSGNVGSPYGSNVIEVPATQAHRYKYVVRFERLGGWYGKACKKFALAAGQIRYIAFNEDSQGGWAAAPGSLVPVDGNGGYASTWGEFDFGSTVNLGWSGFDVSAIAAQNAGLEVQGMKICEVLTRICSYIGPAAAFVHNAYTSAVADIGGIGGKLAPGPVRLAVTIGYNITHA
ncbi:Allergen [Penicillium canescens]|uniref:Allergen n=1 Tax=Penicillium canescens TaxID=5083 RepID=A0AAD6ICI7_PENCN|nr:Allergen [Penicillium canescens]KAJ6019867.1 Allergen [Penicillium canescens]KAJ6039176.1 Allergen [Penicillium canescens]KAJ6047051.1 Allergen [Penicillium canescens]KAJ6059796.1 Allergen [Penicillium canescens]KAJ6093672.1 Allergen [Penicillium canescens]